jgi:C-terminal processing protease CtpA/Prc
MWAEFRGTNAVIIAVRPGGDAERAAIAPGDRIAPVVVLVNHWTGSIGEGMAIGLDAMHRARVVGTPMAHLAGAISDFTAK